MPGRIYNTVVNLTDTFTLNPKQPTVPSLSSLMSIEKLKSQIMDSSGNFKILANVDVSGVTVTPDVQKALDDYLKWAEKQQAYLDARQLVVAGMDASGLVIKAPSIANGSPVIHTIYIDDAVRSGWDTTAFLTFIITDLSRNWNATDTPLRWYSDASGGKSTENYQQLYKGGTRVTRFSQFVMCELGESVVFSPSLLSSTFVMALRNAMCNIITGKPTEMGKNAFSQLMNASIGDKANIMIREVYVDSNVKITPFAASGTLGDFIVELVVKAS